MPLNVVSVIKKTKYLSKHSTLLFIIMKPENALPSETGVLICKFLQQKNCICVSILHIKCKSDRINNDILTHL